MRLSDSVDQFLRALRPSGRVEPTREPFHVLAPATVVNGPRHEDEAPAAEVEEVAEAPETLPPAAPLLEPLDEAVLGLPEDFEPKPERVEGLVFDAPAEDAEPGPDTGGELEVAAPARRSADLATLERVTEIAETLGLGYHLGSAVERIALASTRGSDGAADLREATWLIERYAELLERRPIGADVHRARMELARTGDAISDLQALAAALDEGAWEDALRIAESEPEQEQPEADAPAAVVEVEAPAPEEPEVPADEPRPEKEPYPLSRELLLMGARFLLTVVAVIVVVLVVTLVASLA